MISNDWKLGLEQPTYVVPCCTSDPYNWCPPLGCQDGCRMQASSNGDSCLKLHRKRDVSWKRLNIYSPKRQRKGALGKSSNVLYMQTRMGSVLHVSHRCCSGALSSELSAHIYKVGPKQMIVQLDYSLVENVSGNFRHAQRVIVEDVSVAHAQSLGIYARKAAPSPPIFLGQNRAAIWNTFVKLLSLA